jgi:hypothetical protein
MTDDITPEIDVTILRHDAKYANTDELRVSCTRAADTIERLKARIAELEQQVKHLCADAAEADSDIRESAKRVLPASVVDGDRESVPTIQEVVEMVVEQVAALRADAERWRYIRNHLDANANPRGMSWGVTIPAERGDVLFYRVEDAIDAARAKTE